MSVFEILRERLDLPQLAERFTHLKRAGKLFCGRCPIPNHDDSTPSFYVYPDGYWHCYGCRSHGDVVDLWAACRGIQPGIEAALDLAREYGIKLPERDPEAQAKASERRRKEDDFARQVEAYHQQLARHPHVAQWWRDHGFCDELQKRFLLGSNKDGTAATSPFWNRGRVCGLIRRQLNAEPKYLLPPVEEFPDGHKPLFIIRGVTDFYLVVEGFIDALACNTLGFSVVALGGTGISEHQKAELQKLKGDLFLLPDDDEAGAETGRAWAQELYHRARLCPAEYGDGLKDAADLFAAEGEKAKSALEGLMARSVDALGLALSEAPKGTAQESYRYFRDVVLPLLLRIEDSGERNAAADDAAKALGLKATDLRRMLKQQDTSEDEESNTNVGLMLHDPEPWPERVDGVTLLVDITAVVGRFLSAADCIIKAIALWVVYTFAYDLFDTSPLLAVVSPEKRCGKTTLLTLLYALVPRPLPVSNITGAALFRTVERSRPVLLIDEADSFLTDNEELRGIVNSGHRKAIAFVIRTVGEEHEPRQFTTWTPKAIALIGSLPGTLEDRAVVVRLERKRPGDATERLRYDRLGEFDPLRRRAARWVDDVKDALRSADPAIPQDIMNDRARDNWRPLLAIADAAGGDWPYLAREVARTFSSAEPEAESVRVLLLQDLRALFAERGDLLESEEIVEALVEIEDRPWAEWRNGKALSKTALANQLRPFKVQPRKWREGKRSARGYKRGDFEEVFARYLPTQTPQTPQATDSTTYGSSETPQDPPPVADEIQDNSYGINSVAFVAVQSGEGVRGNGSSSGHAGDETSDELEERMAILEFEGGLSRAEAERAARAASAAGGFINPADFTV